MAQQGNPYAQYGGGVPQQNGFLSGLINAVGYLGDAGDNIINTPYPQPAIFPVLAGMANRFNMQRYNRYHAQNQLKGQQQVGQALAQALNNPALEKGYFGPTEAIDPMLNAQGGVNAGTMATKMYNTGQFDSEGHYIPTTALNDMGGIYNTRSQGVANFLSGANGGLQNAYGQGATAYNQGGGPINPQAPGGGAPAPNQPAVQGGGQLQGNAAFTAPPNYGSGFFPKMNRMNIFNMATDTPQQMGETFRAGATGAGNMQQNLETARHNMADEGNTSYMNHQTGAHYVRSDANDKYGNTTKRLEQQDQHNGTGYWTPKDRLDIGLQDQNIKSEIEARQTAGRQKEIDSIEKQLVDLGGKVKATGQIKEITDVTHPNYMQYQRLKQRLYDLRNGGAMVTAPAEGSVSAPFQNTGASALNTTQQSLVNKWRPKQ